MGGRGDLGSAAERQGHQAERQYFDRLGGGSPVQCCPTKPN